MRTVHTLYTAKCQPTAQSNTQLKHLYTALLGLDVLSEAAQDLSLSAPNICSFEITTEHYSSSLPVHLGAKFFFSIKEGKLKTTLDNRLLEGHNRRISE